MAVQRQLSTTSQALLLVMACVILNAPNGSQYKVEGSIWSIPPYPTYYSNWSSSHCFFVGDVLRNLIVFEFRTGFYNVMQVSRREYEACTADNPFPSFRKGPARVPLIEKGVFCFICSVSCYCSLGQKVEVAVYHHPVPDVVPPVPPLPVQPVTATEVPSCSCSPRQLFGKGMGPSHELFMQAQQHQLVLLLCLLVTLLLVVDHDFVGCDLRS